MEFLIIWIGSCLLAFFGPMFVMLLVDGLLGR